MRLNILKRTGLLLVWLWGMWSGALCGQTPPVPATPPAPPAPPSAAESRSYAEAYNRVLDGAWADAIRALEQHLKKYPSSTTSDDANFFLCHSKSKVSNLMEDACQCYADFISKYREGSYVKQAGQDLVVLSHQLSRMGKPECEIRAKTIRQGDNEDIKLMVLIQLLESGEEETILPRIFKMYDQSGPSTREKIIYILADSDSPEVSVKLGQIVQTDPSIEIRKKAVYALSDRGGQEALNAMKEVLHSKNDIEVRKAALFALGDSGDSSVIPYLRDVAVSDASEELSKAATFAISNAEGPDAMKALETILKSAKSVEVRKAALFALGDLEGEGSVAALKTVALGDSEVELRKAAVFAIANNESKAATQALREILAASKDVEVQKASLYAVADQGGREVIPELMKLAIEGENEELARGAVHALMNATEGHDTAPLLEVFRKSRHERVRKEALYAIAGGDRVAIGSLVKILAEEKEDEYRLAAVHALAQSDSKEVVAALSNAAKKDSSIRVRSAAVEALGQIGTPEAREALMQILEEQE